MWNVWPQTQWVPSVQKNATNSMVRVQMGCAIWERKDFEDLDKDGALVMPWLWPIILHVWHFCNFQTRGRMICKTCCLESSWAQSCCREKVRVHFTFYFSESLQTSHEETLNDYKRPGQVSLVADVQANLINARKTKYKNYWAADFLTFSVVSWFSSGL